MIYIFFIYFNTKTKQKIYSIFTINTSLIVNFKYCWTSNSKVKFSKCKMKRKNFLLHEVMIQTSKNSLSAFWHLWSWSTIDFSCSRRPGCPTNETIRSSRWMSIMIALQKKESYNWKMEMACTFEMFFTE